MITILIIYLELFSTLLIYTLQEYFSFFELIKT